MHFKYPEVFYAFFALLIPILIHLFQLRRFQKVHFTNVKFLKSVVVQTRKSSQLKKWLLLITRMLLIAFLILAFAQPFLPNEVDDHKTVGTVIYLDNSFSMQAKGAKGPLLQRAIQDILKVFPNDTYISLFTNTKNYIGSNKEEIKNELLQLAYSPNQLSYKSVYLKAKQLFSSTKDVEENIIMISDFQKKKNALDIPEDPNTKTHLVQVQPVTKQNIAIDSVYLQRNDKHDLVLKVQVSNSQNKQISTTISVYNNVKLLARTTLDVPPSNNIITEFHLEENEKINGKVVLEDPSLTFDNTRYFTINAPNKVKVFVINESNDAYLKKIFSPEDFDYFSISPNQINYNQLSNSNLVILNEVVQIPQALKNILKSFHDQGGVICFIPAINGDLDTYQQFVSSFSEVILSNQILQEKKITKIHFDHPLYKGVFDKRIDNFQYPIVNKYYPLNSKGNIILSYEDQSPFLVMNENIYIFTAALNRENSNFKNSPLIVPTILNMAKHSLKIPEISYTIGQKVSCDVPISLKQDEVLTLVSEHESIIPLQQSFPTKVRITTEDSPSNAGIYAIKNKDKTIQHLGYNYVNDESNLDYHSLSKSNAYLLHDSIVGLFDFIKEKSNVIILWKWFILMSLLMLIVEILLLKYLK